MQFTANTHGDNIGRLGLMSGAKEGKNRSSLFSEVFGSSIHFLLFLRYVSLWDKDRAYLRKPAQLVFRSGEQTTPIYTLLHTFLGLSHDTRRHVMRFL
jgi:hypothetical protein